MIEFADFRAKIPMIYFLVGTGISVLDKMVSVMRNGTTAPRPLMWYIKSGAKAVSDGLFALPI